MFLYRLTFIGILETNEEFRNRYSGLMLTDTIEYYKYYNKFGDSWFSAILTGEVKNYLGPILLIHIAGMVPFGDLLVNGFFLLLATIFLEKMLCQLGTNAVSPFVLLICNPMIIYYAQGYNKEIPMVFCTILFAYSFVSKSSISAIIAILFALVFRTQMAIYFIGFYFVRFFFDRYEKKRAYLWVLSIPAMLVFPYIYRKLAHVFIESSNYYYSQSGGNGIGKAATEMLMSVPLGPYVGIPIHAIQNILEPVMSISLNTMYDRMSLLSLFIIMPYFVIIIVQVFINLFYRAPKRETYTSYDIHLFVVLGITFISLNPIIHSRYLFSFLPLLSMSVMRRRDRQGMSPFLSSVMISCPK